MTQDSSTALLILHSVRLMGFADAPALALRFGLDPAVVADGLLDAEASGWVQRSGFADVKGWSLTEAGRAENKRLLADELTRVGGRDEIAAVYDAFLPLNARLQQACTDWQLRPALGDRLAANDHADPAWDTRVLDELAALDCGLTPLAARLSNVLARMRGYEVRFGAALQRARAGDHGAVDRTDVDSCHRVWFELHEDLIATLGLERGAES